MNRHAWLVPLLAVSLASCLRRAPTNFELDRRAGMPVPAAAGTTFEEPVWASSTVAPEAEMPARTPPKIIRVWVADQILEDGSWLQGTWLFLEAEPPRWLPEVDPGSAPLLSPVVVTP